MLALNNCQRNSAKDTRANHRLPSKVIPMFKTSIKPNTPLLHIVLLIFSLFFSLTPPIYPLHAALRVNSPVIAQEQPPLPGYPIQYTSFAGTTYQLTAYDGKFVRYALPGSWTSPGALTPSQLRRLIDLTDLTYALLTEITSGEPQGTGLLTIAVIPTGANAGHAGSGFKVGVRLHQPTRRRSCGGHTHIRR